MNGGIGFAASQPSVAILVSTYNGELFIDEQIKSLLEQTYDNYQIFVRDDGSTDSTISRLEKFEESETIVFARDNLGNLGSAQSFLSLLKVAKADVYMFCDQDDVWLSQKVSNAVEILIANGIDRPILYHSDLKIVDRHLTTISDSFSLQQGLSMPAAHRLGVLSVQNSAVGCTCAITEALVRTSMLRERQPHFVAMHDWWFALVAVCFGEIVYDQRACILYRQHGGNLSGIGGGRSGFQKLLFQLSSAGITLINRYKLKVAEQSAEFLEFYGERMNSTDRATLQAVKTLKNGSGFIGCLQCCLKGIRFQNWYMNASLVFSSVVTLFIRPTRAN